MSLAKPMAGPMRMLPPVSTAPAGMDIRRLLGMLLRRLPVVLSISVLGGLLGYAIQSAIPPRYTSLTEILLDPKRADSFGAEASFANIYVDSTKIASVLSVIQSSQLLARVVQSEKLADDPEFGDVQESVLNRWFGFLPFLHAPAAPSDRQAREDRALDRLTRAVRVNRGGVTYVLTVDVSARNPQTAQRLAQAVAAAYLNDQVEMKVAATRRDSLWLADRLNDLRRKLEESEEAVEAVRKK